VGSMELAQRGVLVTRLSAAEDAANMDIVCADKTGTLTMNRLSLKRALPQLGFTENEVISMGALASAEADQDPIDMAFLRAARERKLIDDTDRTLRFTPFTSKTRRTEALVESGGRSVQVMKGALDTIAGAIGLSSETIAALQAIAHEQARTGFRTLAVAAADQGQPFRLVGLVSLYDPPRPDSRELIAELHSCGVAVKMLTGDALPVAEEVAHELGLGEVTHAPQAAGATRNMADVLISASGFAEVYPEDKFLVVKTLQSAGHVVGMTGDGVNDAPALRQAEVGIAVSGATDVAKGAASVVLTTDGLEGIVDLVKNGRAIYQRILTWIINKISRTILKSGLVVIAFLVTGKFVISALGMILLIFMTDFMKITLSTDRVHPSQNPETWNIGSLVTVGALLGLLMVFEGLGLLWTASAWFGLFSDNGRLYTFTFQMFLFFALFSIISIRERSAFWASRPSLILALAMAGDGCLGLLIGAVGLAELRPLPFAETALVIVYTMVCTLGVNDTIKRALIRRL
jgi:H+-transporting ATPase